MKFKLMHLNKMRFFYEVLDKFEYLEDFSIDHAFDNRLQ